MRGAVVSSAILMPPESSRLSLIEREPMPSTTTPARSSDRAACSSMTSPPTDRPSPPIAPGAIPTLVAQVGRRSGDVPAVGPAEQVGLALAVALSAPVHQQDAVAVPGEHAGLVEARASGEDEHDGAVPRRGVPAGELEAVGGRELHALGSVRRGRALS